MRDWDYDNDQWTKLPTHQKHLPLFTRHIDMFSILIRAIFAVVLKLTFHLYIRTEVRGDYKKLYRDYPRLLIIANHASHLDATSIAASASGSRKLNTVLPPFST